MSVMKKIGFKLSILQNQSYKVASPYFQDMARRKTYKSPLLNKLIM